MSLILEALKKSEAERRLGQAPGLMTPMPSPQRVRSHVAPIAAAATAVLVIGIATWWWWWQHETPSEREPGPASASTQIQSSNESTPTATASIPQPAQASERPEAAADIPAAQTSSAPRDNDVSADTPHDPGFESIERESIPQAAAASTAVTQTPPPVPASAPETVAEEARGTAPPIESALPVAATPVQRESSEPEYPRLDQLPVDERGALPPLKLSMHVFSEQVPDRFVLIDGRRYGEGEKLANSLQVVSIRRDGVLLDFNGRLFLLPRP